MHAVCLHHASCLHHVSCMHHACMHVGSMATLSDTSTGPRNPMPPQVLTHVQQAHKLWLAWHERLGPFVRIRVAHHELVLIADPAAASEILNTGPNYCPKRPPQYGEFDWVRWGLGWWIAAVSCMAPMAGQLLSPSLAACWLNRLVRRGQSVDCSWQFEPGMVGWLRLAV